MSAVLKQQSLFETAATLLTVEKETLPILYPPKVSYSLLSTLEACPRRYFYLYPGTWRGWEPDAPVAVKEAYWHKKLQGWQGWAGHIVHKAAEAMLWNDIDQVAARVTGVTPQTDAELLERVRVRFEGEWRQSRSWTEEAFRKTPQRAKPVWLLEHQSGTWPSIAAGDYDPVNVKARNTCRRWVDRSVASLLQRRHLYHDGVNWDKFLVIEGKRVQRGVIVQPDGEPPQSQAALRAADTYPSVPLVVDGVEWQLAMTPDLMVYTPQNKYLIVDFKTGRRRKWSKHLEQLQLYAAFMLREWEQFAFLDLPPVTEENLILRAVYTDPKESGGTWEQYEVRRGDAGRFLDAAIQKVRDLCGYHRCLHELDDEERQELQHLLSPRLFSTLDSIDPASLVCLLSLTLPVQASRGNVKMCQPCSCLASCQEGKELVEIAKKK